LLTAGKVGKAAQTHRAPGLRSCGSAGRLSRRCIGFPELAIRRRMQRR
jgi:hypothetical protein